jgi:hypothetical protein
MLTPRRPQFRTGGDARKLVESSNSLLPWATRRWEFAEFACWELVVLAMLGEAEAGLYGRNNPWGAILRLRTLL